VLCGNYPRRIARRTVSTIASVPRTSSFTATTRTGTEPPIAAMSRDASVSLATMSSG
jgi:hypothetical protein